MHPSCFELRTRKFIIRMECQLCDPNAALWLGIVTGLYSTEERLKRRGGGGGLNKFLAPKRGNFREWGAFIRG